MLYIILFIILGVILFIIIKKIKKLEKKDQAEKEALLPENATIKDVGLGGVISISGFTEDYQDLDFVVEQVNRYERGSFEWFELVGSHGDRRLFLEWELDDGEFFITATSSRKGFRLNKLGLTEDDLIAWDENKSDKEYFDFENEKYYFEQAGEVLYYEKNRGPGSGYYAWYFMNEDKTKVLSIEKWEGEAFEVFTGVVINHSDIQIYKVK